MLQQPFKTYNGGKSGNGTYQTIINHIPPHQIFIDAMVGNAGISSKIKTPAVIVINDIDHAIISAYNLGPSQPVIKENLDYRDLIDKYEDNASNILFYFDPPYLKETRKSQQDLYKFEWSHADHLKFLDKVNTINNKCMVSHYPCGLYDLALACWKKVEFYSMTRQGKALEAIYFNYEVPTILHDYQFVGKSFTDRQRIQRKITRTVTKLKALPPTERNAIVAGIIDAFNYSEE